MPPDAKSAGVRPTRVSLSVRRPPSNSKTRYTLTSRGRSASKRSSAPQCSSSTATRTSARRSPMQSGMVDALRGAGTRVTFLTEDETGHSFPGAETLRAYSEWVDEAVAPSAALPEHGAGRLCRPAPCV